MASSLFNTQYFSEMIQALNYFWGQQGCVILPNYDMEMGAATFHPKTTLKSLGKQPWKAAFLQPCRRPTDGRYGENPNRLQHYYQYQVVLKPNPANSTVLFLDSLRALGINTDINDIRFVEDNWESPTLGAWGLGWELWLNGMEVAQYTYFQSICGYEVNPPVLEITYGLERIALFIQNKNNIMDLAFNSEFTYRDIYYQSEVENSYYNFNLAPTTDLFNWFEGYLSNADLILNSSIVAPTGPISLPAYDYVIKASHVFNLLDARKAISPTLRQQYILRIREKAKACADQYILSQEARG